MIRTTFFLALVTSLLSACSLWPLRDNVPENPLLETSDLPLGYPAFDQIRNAHFAPAFEAGMREHAAEITAIASHPEPPDFGNTIVALERSGQRLGRVSRIFFALSSANTNAEIDAIRVEMAPRLAAHQDAIYLNAALFARVDSVYLQRDHLNLNPEQRRLVERYHSDFVRAGARLPEAAQARLRDLNQRISELTTAFSQQVLEERNASLVFVSDAARLAGLSEQEIAAAASAATAAGRDGEYALKLLNYSAQPQLAKLHDRGLRQRLLEASLARGLRGNEHDNRNLILELVRLRAQRARILGYPSHAAYVLEDSTAQTTEAVGELLGKLAPAAVANVQLDARELQALIDAEGGGFRLQAWDWPYYAEKLRLARYDFDEAQMRPYLELDRVLEDGVFYMAKALYGLDIRQRHDLPVYHPDVTVWDVFDADGQRLGIFLFDPFARDSKRGGAWMNAYVPQNRLLGHQPVVANHLNITKPSDGGPVLLSFDEVNTLFHEFGHALHGLFSDVEYPYFSGTSVPRDFVEYPSQVHEMWATWPEILQRYARHHATGEPMPEQMVERFMAARQFNQGYATTAYLAAALLDQAWHQLTPEQVPLDVEAFERKALRDAGVLLDEVPPRYRSAYFSHIFAGGYSAGYYAYIWSEVLDADTVAWFERHGGLKRINGDWMRENLLSRGGSRDAMELFELFLGRPPQIQPLLDRRGLNAVISQ